MTEHVCHAHDCTTIVPPRMLMCSRHWFSLPAKLRAAVWRHYVPGQEQRKNPSASYMAIQYLAVCHTAFKAFDEASALACAGYLIQAKTWQTQALSEGLPDPLEGLLP
jgi:hypothetical protein